MPTAMTRGFPYMLGTGVGGTYYTYETAPEIEVKLQEEIIYKVKLEEEIIYEVKLIDET